MAQLEINLTPPAAGRSAAADELKGLAVGFIILFQAARVLVWHDYLRGALGLDMLVLLSGLGLASGASYDNARTFLLRQARRLLPAYWVVLTCYIVGNEVLLHRSYDPGNLVAHYLGLHILFGDGWGLAINESFWLISALLGFYVSYCPLHRLLDEPDRFVFWAAVISTGVVLLLALTGNPDLVGLLGMRTGGFFIGLLAGHVLRTGRLVVPLNARLALGLLIFAYLPFSSGLASASALVALTVMAAYVWWLRPRLNGLRGRAVARALAFLGTNWLEIFLIHAPLMRAYTYVVLARWFDLIRPGPATLMMGMAAAVAVTLVVSAHLHRLLQKLSFPAKA